MTPLLLLPILLQAVTTSPTYPTCLVANTTWDQDYFLDITLDIATPELCQVLCQDSSSCQAVTWLTAISDIFPLSCSTFSSSTTAVLPCSDCVSGPSLCSCSQPGECVVEDGNILEVLHDIGSEVECQQLCQGETLCQHYTYFGDASVLR